MFTLKSRKPDGNTCVCGENMIIDNQEDFGIYECPKCGRWYYWLGPWIIDPWQYEIDQAESAKEK